ncbi:MAG TPA: hypothetical protein VMU88_03435 [bacterium]|nr:hypothetical protein [bacterium]
MAEEKKAAKKKTRESRSLWRLLFWEALAAAGYYWMTRHASPPEWKTSLLRENAVFFLAAYPLLFLYRWVGVEGFWGVLLGPLALVLGLALGVSSYLWCEYGFLLAKLPYAGILRAHWIILGLFFAPLYLLLLRNLMGVSKIYYTMEECLALGLWTVLGGGTGFWLGRILDDHFSQTPFFMDHRFILWLGLIWLGAILALLLARKKK